MASSPPEAVQVGGGSFRLLATRPPGKQSGADQEQSQCRWLRDVGSEFSGNRIVKAELVEVLRARCGAALKNPKIVSPCRKPRHARDDRLVKVECGRPQKPLLEEFGT